MTSNYYEKKIEQNKQNFIIPKSNMYNLYMKILQLYSSFRNRILNTKMASNIGLAWFRCS